VEGGENTEEKKKQKKWRKDEHRIPICRETLNIQHRIKKNRTRIVRMQRIGTDKEDRGEEKNIKQMVRYIAPYRIPASAGMTRKDKENEKDIGIGNCGGCDVDRFG